MFKSLKKLSQAFLMLIVIVVVWGSLPPNVVRAQPSLIPAIEREALVVWGHDVRDGDG